MPLTIEDDLLDRGLELLGEALREVAQEAGLAGKVTA
jgi:hypothetical protein